MQLADYAPWGLRPDSLNGIEANGIGFLFSILICKFLKEQDWINRLIYHQIFKLWSL